MFPEYSEQEHGTLNMNLITPEPHVYISDSDTSPEKARPNGDGEFTYCVLLTNRYIVHCVFCI